jgi:hypothetical protein
MVLDDGTELIFELDALRRDPAQLGRVVTQKALLISRRLSGELGVSSH